MTIKFEYSINSLLKNNGLEAVPKPPIKVIRGKQLNAECLRSLYESTDKSFLGFFLLNEPFLLLRDTKLINNVLSTNFHHFTDRTVVDNESDRYGRYFLLLSSGEKWKPLRTFLTPVFSTAKTKSMIPLISEMFFIITFVILSTLTFLCYWCSTKNFDYWQKRKVPYIKPIPFIGNISTVIRQQQSIGEFLRSLYESTDKPYLGFFLLNEPILFLRDTKLINNVLNTNFHHFTDRTAVDNEFDRYGRHLMLLSGGKKWKSLRTSVTSLFSTGKNKSMIPLISEVCDRLVNCINETVVNKKSVDVRSLCVNYAIDIVCCCFFGLNSHCLDTKNSHFSYMTHKFTETTFARGIQMVSYFVAPFLVKTFRMKFLDPTAANFMRDVLFQTLAEREKTKLVRGDLIDILLKSYKQHPNDIAEQDKLAGMFIQFLTAGYDTSGNTFAYALFELSRHQDIQTRLRNEINDLLKRHGSITYEVLQEMKYLDMVVKETLRKYPILPFLDRRCVKTLKLPDYDLVVEKGIGVYISLFGLHYDPQYFPNPEEFDPERFAKNDEILLSAFFPFGGGLRKCIGSRFAILSIKLVLVKLLLNFLIEKSEDATDSISFAHITRGTTSTSSSSNVDYEQQQQLQQNRQDDQSNSVCSSSANAMNMDISNFSNCNNKQLSDEDKLRVLKNVWSPAVNFDFLFRKNARLIPLSNGLNSDDENLSDENDFNQNTKFANVFAQESDSILENSDDREEVDEVIPEIDLDKSDSNYEVPLATLAQKLSKKEKGKKLKRKLRWEKKFIDIPDDTTNFKGSENFPADISQF
ncbi:hypothetical protein RN001_012888 [Aquatica leii]|uniref:Cytochrome P450 n=1 Tax=Aquatica leii TaxID=1421715 RepID=A0AAN7S7Y9_9COLE|nr:hypothetical protein RN001_012888 [Aquatica leii]